MKNLIVLLMFVVLAVANAYSNTLWVSEDGEVLAETDRYRVMFKNGSIDHFYNKLTHENYTQSNYGSQTRIITHNDGLKASNTRPTEILEITPLKYKIIYKRGSLELHLLISIDPQTSDLVIQQIGNTDTTGIISVTWGFSNLSHTALDLILPYKGGQVFSEFSDPGIYNYPGRWEAQLAILQGDQGGVFVRSDDTQYLFKAIWYDKELNSKDFSINFLSHPNAPYEHQKQFTTATWRLNAYQGGWEVPALYYKQWMHKSLQPVDRNLMPAWVNDIELVIFHSGVDPDILPILNQYVDSQKTLIHTHGWRTVNQDENLPDYTLVEENFGDFMQKSHQYGFKVMAHVNMIGVSVNHPLYKEFEQYQVRNPNTGEKMGWLWEDLSDPNRHASINPASQSFRTVMINRLKDVWDIYKVMLSIWISATLL